MHVYVSLILLPENRASYKLQPKSNLSLQVVTHNLSQRHENTRQVNMYILLGVNETFVTCSGGARGSLVVKALCYKSEGRGFDTR
jgi:hypothetical protein